jgi:polyhydroxyalkanoate synthesis regulator phasin
MRNRASIVLTGALALAGLTGGAVVVPALAAAATTEQSTAAAVGDRVDRITQALQGLVDDGTLTAEQQRRVAETLDAELPRRGPGGHGHGRGGKRLDLGAAAEVLGVSEDELHTALHEGKSLAQVAQEQDVERQALVDALVASAQERLAQAVTDGRLTQEEADARRAELPERIEQLVDREGLPARGHRGPPPQDAAEPSVPRS